MTRSIRCIAALCALGGAAFAAVPAPGQAASPEVVCSEHHDSRVRAMTDDGIALTSSLGLAAGRYALPAATAPTTLVLFFHGHGNDSCGWRTPMQRVAARGGIAVTMDNTGQSQSPSENYGWFVREGAADAIAAAHYFMAAYPSVTKVIAFGVSMGGNTSGVAVASPDALRADGSPLFDYWVDVEGVNNLIEEYLVARGVAPVNAGGAQAQQEIELENGGSLEASPERYVEITNVARAADMRGLRGAIVVNAIDDGLVTTDQSPQMASTLNGVGVPAHLFTVVGRGGAETGSTLSGTAGGPLSAAAGQPPYQSPLAGHGSESSSTHLVIQTGFDQLFALMEGATVSPGHTIVPGV